MTEMGYEDLQDELIEVLKERNDLAAQLTEALKPKVCRWRKRGTECGWNLPLHQPDGNFCEYCGGLIGVDNE